MWLILVLSIIFLTWLGHKFIKWLTSPVEYEIHITEEDYKQLKKKLK